MRHVLLVGEGNFSYALARARQATSCGVNLVLTATSFDSAEEVQEKYPESAGILKSLQKQASDSL